MLLNGFWGYFLFFFFFFFFESKHSQLSDPFVFLSLEFLGSFRKLTLTQRWLSHFPPTLSFFRRTNFCGKKKTVTSNNSIHNCCRMWETTSFEFDCWRLSFPWGLWGLVHVYGTNLEDVMLQLSEITWKYYVCIHPKFENQSDKFGSIGRLYLENEGRGKWRVGE